MDWMQIGSALLLGAMLVFLWPRARAMLRDSPKGSTQDWIGFALPIAAVALFVLLLMSVV